MIYQWFFNLLMRMGVTFRPMVFCYHTIGREALWRQIRFLTSVFETTGLDQIQGAGRNVITFTMDDCRAMDVELWDEVTSRFEISATLFIPVKHHLNQSPLWPDQLKRLFQGSTEFAFHGQRYDVSTRAKSDASFAAICTHIYASDLNTEEVEAYLDEVLRESGMEVDPCYRVVGPERMKELLSNPHISVGSHSMTHAFLAKTSTKALEPELVDSKSYLENQYSTRCSPCFCYPYGSHHLIGDAAKVLAKRHYARAVVMDGRAVNGDTFAIGRIALYDNDTIFRLCLKIVKAQLT